MPLKYKRRLLLHLAHDTYEPKPAQALAEELGEDPGEFLPAVEALAEEGVIDIDDRGRVALPRLEQKGELTGTFRGNPKGFGFVNPHQKIDEGAIFIPPHATAGALSGDTVRIAYFRDFNKERRDRDGERKYIGEVVEITERRRSSFSGTMTRSGQRWMCDPDGKSLTKPVIIRDADSKNVTIGDKVVIELTEYPDGDAPAEGVIVRVLGEAGLPDVETQAVIAAYALPGEFEDDCVEQARQATRDFDEQIALWEREGPDALPGRLDITGRFDKANATFVCTIDPPDAKDYDDAISLEELPNGGFELGVHIADVGHFIDMDTTLDLEARKRGNSTYLPRLVLPMLPEILSNGICSLQEGVPRFAKSFFIRYNNMGQVTAEGARSVLIQSAKRMTYLEAQALIDGDEAEARKHAKTDTEYTPQLITTVKRMNRLAKLIQARRHQAGMISLDLPDAELVYDDNGHVCDVVPEDDAYTHKLIEMFMVEANEAVARLFEKLSVPLIRRTHPEPVPGEVGELRKAAKISGFTIPKSPSREELQGLLDATRGTPAARPVHLAVLKTLTKAEYSPAHIGHFALASSAYAHFTSPIRRYADLTVHRSLGEYLRRTKNGANSPKNDKGWRDLGRDLSEHKLCPPQDVLLEIAQHITHTEVNSSDAERELRSFLVLQFLTNHIGEEFQGVITGVTMRGVFVQLDKFLADGLIPRHELPGDTTRGGKPPKWTMDDRTGAIVDMNSGRSFKMGDMVRVCIAQVDLARRQMDLVISNPDSRAGGKGIDAFNRKDQTKGGASIASGGGLLAGNDLGALGSTSGAGFKTPGAKRRSAKSKRRDKGKTDHRRDKK